MVFGQEGKRPFEARIEQALGLQQLAQPFDAFEQFTEADGANLGHSQRDRASRGVKLQLAVHDDLDALGQFDRRVLDEISRADHGQRHVGGRVAQHDERDRGSQVQLGDLALHPHCAELVDVLRDAHGDRANRPGVVGGLARLGVGHFPSPLGWSLGGRAGDPVGQQRLEGCACLGGVLVRQQRLEVGDPQRRQPRTQLCQGERLVVELFDDLGRARRRRP